MSTKNLMIISSAAATSQPSQAVARPVRFELPRAKNFIEKSLSEDTRRAYTRALLDFFSLTGKPPARVEVEDVIAYRDDLVKKKRRKARTVNMSVPSAEWRRHRFCHGRRHSAEGTHSTSVLIENPRERHEVGKAKSSPGWSYSWKAGKRGERRKSSDRSTRANVAGEATGRPRTGSALSGEAEELCNESCIRN
jgi:hypothetical protein